jgi:molybdopterin-guanine dinucleotide biosynthesis protein A
LVGCLLLRAQSGDCAVTMASLGGKVQTFPAVIDRAALPELRAELEAGRRKCIDAFRVAAAALGRPLTVLPAEPLVLTGEVGSALSPPQWFLNVNTEDDLRMAESLARHLIA